MVISLLISTYLWDSLTQHSTKNLCDLLGSKELNIYKKPEYLIHAVFKKTFRRVCQSSQHAYHWNFRWTGFDLYLPISKPPGKTSCQLNLVSFFNSLYALRFYFISFRESSLSDFANERGREKERNMLHVGVKFHECVSGSVGSFRPSFLNFYAPGREEHGNRAHVFFFETVTAQADSPARKSQWNRVPTPDQPTVNTLMNPFSFFFHLTIGHLTHFLSASGQALPRVFRISR